MSTEKRPTAEWRTITPRDAEQLLAHNTHNRNINQRRVEQFARALDRGEWIENGEAIKIAQDGTLLDGQHRVHAILEADIAMRTLVISGLPSQAQETMDQGRARKLGDILKLRNEIHAAMLAAALRALDRYIKEGRIGESGSNSPASAQELLELLGEHPHLRVSVQYINAISQRLPGRLGTGATAALHYLFSSVDGAEAEEFFELISHGEGLRRGNPIWFYRERIIRELKGGANKIRPTVRYALMVKTFNQWRAGVQMQQLSWRPGGIAREPFPLVEGCPLNPDADSILAYQDVSEEAAAALVRAAAPEQDLEAEAA